MSTWHQDKGGAIPALYEPHATGWKVYSNPPGGFASSIIFATEQEARVFLAANLARGLTGLQIIPPKGDGTVSRLEELLDLRATWLRENPGRFLEPNDPRDSARWSLAFPDEADELAELTDQLKEDKPTPEQAAAVRRFAEQYGGRWKADLHICWRNASYPHSPEADRPLLQQVRNQFGPLWLETVTMDQLKED